MRCMEIERRSGKDVDDPKVEPPRTKPELVVDVVCLVLGVERGPCAPSMLAQRFPDKSTYFYSKKPFPQLKTT